MEISLPWDLPRGHANHFGLVLCVLEFHAWEPTSPSLLFFLWSIICKCLVSDLIIYQALKGSDVLVVTAILNPLFSISSLGDKNLNYLEMQIGPKNWMLSFLP